MSKLSKQEFQTREQLDQALAQHVSELLIEAIAIRGNATLVVSGGTTPLGFFGLLSKQHLDWKRVLVTLADDRWLSEHHQDSNARLVKEHLLVNQAAHASFLSLKTEDLDPDDAIEGLQNSFAEIGEIDVLILGMGADGHTASLFPNTPSLQEGLNIKSRQSFIGVMPLVAPHQRISMTLARLLNSRKVIVHITGVEKRAVFETACDGFSPRKMPISALIYEAINPIALYWAE
ncbi:6-phosphogluconolactonase [Zhongshania aquimaris]|uniref:6-phosphogluconolactonase n=1 Tax=Zhongshania aquimaris TaxID=2857107 RepID=A0ABS6VX79_9GAMM|nr:6-phosphogluconolactonase [Zhongshania aquimaris]MBW2942236.1 6-phosphogluconolactonase [Zhongshania aquimaris]